MHPGRGGGQSSLGQAAQPPEEENDSLLLSNLYIENPIKSCSKPESTPQHRIIIIAVIHHSRSIALVVSGGALFLQKPEEKSNC